MLMSIERPHTTVNTPRRGGMTIKVVSVLALTAAGAFTVLHNGPSPVVPEATASDKEPSLDLAKLSDKEVVLGLRLRTFVPSRTSKEGKLLPAEEVEFQIIRDTGKGRVIVIDCEGNKQNFIVDPETHGETNYSIASLMTSNGDFELICNDTMIGSAKCMIPTGKLAMLMADLKHRKTEVEEHELTYKPVIGCFTGGETTKPLNIRKLPHEIDRVASK